MQRLGAPDERVDERVRDVVEDGSDDGFDEPARELPVQVELHLARVLGERPEAPFAVKVAKRAILQRDDDRFRRAVRVVRTVG